jgi:hypothetical protein
MLITFYDFNLFSAPVRLPSYLLEYESTQGPSDDGHLIFLVKNICKRFPVTH